MSKVEDRISPGVFLFEPFDLQSDGLKLGEKQGVGENRPAVHHQGNRLALAHSSSAGRTASKSTSRQPTSESMRCMRLASTV